jgi:ferredoxin
MLRFALGLPRRRGTHAVVVATRAGAKIGGSYTPGVEGTATFLVSLILGLKGYNVRGAIGIDMPSNWISLHPGLPPSTVTGIVRRARQRVVTFMDTILSGGRRFVGWISLAFGLSVSWISLAYLLAGRFYLTKLFFASESCTSCGLCAKRCPNKAIRMRGKKKPLPYWTFHCESCMRCMGFCPTRAVEASHLLAVGVYVLAVVIARLPLSSWLSCIPGLALLESVPLWLLESVYAVAALGLIYPLFYLLLRVPWINRFFSRATFTYYYRRYHEPGTTFKELDD